MTQPDSAPRSLDIFLLGLVDFDSLLTLQEEAWAQQQSRLDPSSVRGVVFLCEHPLGITFGREATADDLSASESDLRAWSIRSRWLARGGGAILHGPGQLAMTTIFPLDAWGWTPGDLRRQRKRLVRDLHIVFHTLHQQLKAELRSRHGHFKRHLNAVDFAIVRDLALDPLATLLHVGADQQT